MKTKLAVALAAVVLLPMVCFCEQVNLLYDLEQREGVYFTQGSDVPYSGAFKYFDELEGDSSAGNMKNGKIHGEWKYFNGDGKLAHVANYKDGVLHGEQKAFHENGKLSNLAIYKDGELIDAGKAYDKKGNLKQGEEKSFYEGNLANVTSYKNGVPQETKNFNYMGDGKLADLLSYKNGIPQEKKFFDGNGKVIMIQVYKNGQVQGYKRFDNYGNLIEEFVTNYKDGVSHGELRTFDKNGNLIKIDNYIDGKKVE